MTDKTVRKDIVKAMVTEGRRQADDQIEDRRHIESWGPLGEVDTRNHSGHKMTQRERLEGGAVAALDQAGFGYGDKVLALAKGKPDSKEYAAEAERLDIEQNELRDQYPLANIGARALGAIGPLVLGAKVARRAIPAMIENDSWMFNYPGTRMALGLGATGVAEVGYTYQKNKPRGGPVYDPRKDPKRKRK